MAKKVFPLGFWNYAKMGTIGENPVKDWVEAGMNLVLSPTLTTPKMTSRKCWICWTSARRMACR